MSAPPLLARPPGLRRQLGAHIALAQVAMVAGCAAAPEERGPTANVVVDAADGNLHSDIAQGPTSDTAAPSDGADGPADAATVAVCAVGSGGSWRRATSLVLPPAQQGCDLDGDGKPNNALAAGLASALATVNARLLAEVADPQAQWLVRLLPDLTVELYRGRLKTVGQACSTALCNAEVLATPSPDPDRDPCAPLAKLQLQVQGTDAMGLAGPSTATLVLGWKQIPSATLSFLAMTAQPGAQGWAAGLDSGTICGALAIGDTGGGMKGDYDRSGDGIKDSVTFAVEFKTAPVVVGTP